MQTWPVITPWLLGAGLIGFVLALVALRVRQRWIMAIALLMLMGPVLLCGSRWGVFGLDGVDRALYASPLRDALWLPPGTEERWIATGVFPTSELATYVKQTHAGNPFNRLEWLGSLAADDKLYSQYHRTFVRTVLDCYSNAGASLNGRELSLPAALALSDVSSDRSSIIDLMIAHRVVDNGVRTGSASQSKYLWLPVLERELLAGTLSESQRNAFLDSITKVDVSGPSATQVIHPGEVFCVEVATLSSVRRSLDDLPWRTRFKVDTGSFTMLSKLASFTGYTKPQRFWMRAPNDRANDSASPIRVLATTTLSRDSVYLARSRAAVPASFPLHEIKDIDRTRVIDVPVTLAGTNRAAIAQIVSEDKTAIMPSIELNRHANAWDTDDGMDVEITIAVNSPSMSMAFDAQLIDGPTVYGLGTFVAIEGESTIWSLLASGVQNTPHESYVKLTPCPEVLANTPRATTVYGGTPLRLHNFELILAGVHR